MTFNDLESRYENIQFAKNNRMMEEQEREEQEDETCEGMNCDDCPDFAKCNHIED